MVYFGKIIPIFMVIFLLIPSLNINFLFDYSLLLKIKITNLSLSVFNSSLCAKIFFALAFLSGITFINDADAQTIKIVGKIFDEDTREPIPFVTISTSDLSEGTQADSDGFYELELTKGGDTLIFNSMNYIETRRYFGTDTLIQLNVSMKSSSLDLGEVIVLSGENPAKRLMRAVFDNKVINHKSNLEKYSVENYTKLELDIDNIDNKWTNNKLLKDFKFVFDNVDSTSDVKPFLPIYITETIHNVYHVKSSIDKFIPVARKVSGLDNESIITSIATAQDPFDVYDNRIKILERPLVSPFNDHGLNYYEYYLLDSQYIKGNYAYKLKFKPKRSQEPTFFGEFWIDKRTKAPIIVNMRMSQGVNINLIDRVLIFAEYNLFPLANDSVWLPIKEKLILDIHPVKEKSPGMIGRRTTSYAKYNFLNHEIKRLHDDLDPELYDPNALIKQDEFWAGSRHDTLTKNESSVYTLIDSIQNVPIYKKYSQILYTLTSGYIPAGPVEFGSIYSVFNQNPVEKLHFQLGIGSSVKLSKKFWIYGFAGYGIKDEKWKYGGWFQYNLNKFPREVAGIAHRSVLDLSSTSSEEFNTGSNIFATLFRRDVPLKMMNVQESKLFYEKYWLKGWSQRVTFLHRQLDPIGTNGVSTHKFNFRYAPENAAYGDSNVIASEILFKLKYAFKEKFIDGYFERVSLGSKFPIITFNYTAGLQGVMGSRYSYHKISLKYEHYLYLNPFGWTFYSFNIGKTFGNLPYLLMEVHPGNETYGYSGFVFNTMNRYEFASDQYAQFGMTHHFEGFFLNHIPLIRKLKWREIIQFRAVTGSMTETNQYNNRFNFGNTQGTIPIRSPTRVPFMEAGIGIENIFKFFRIDAIWRLNYLDNEEAPPFTLKGSVNFYF